MDIFFHDPEDVPVPPDEVRIREFKAAPYSDKRRIAVYLETNPFMKKPSGEVHLFDPAGNEVASVTIIETITPKMEMTLHLRGKRVPGTYTVKAEVFYEDLIEMPEEGDPTANYETPERTLVDQREVQFELD